MDAYDLWASGVGQNGYAPQQPRPLDPYDQWAAGVGARGTYAVAPVAPKTDYSSIAGAGIQAGGQTISKIAEIMGQSAARQQLLESSNLDRASSAAIAKLRLKAAAEMADRERQFRAQQLLMQAIGHGARNAVNAWDTNRMANKQGSSLLADAFMR